MPKPVSIQFRGATLDGVASDMHAMFAAALLMPNYSEVIKNEAGLFDAFRKFTAEQSAVMTIAGSDDNDIAQRMSEVWAERVLLRLESNKEIKERFVDEITSVFPGIPGDAVGYLSLRDAKGEQYLKPHVCLDMIEVMELIAPLVSTLIDTELPTPPSPPASSPVAEQIERLKAQIASMEKSMTERPKPQGFAKPAEAISAES